MKKVSGSFFVLVFLFCLWGIPSFAADPSEEIEQLKGEVKKLLQKIEELEKRQTETEMKAKEAEKKVIEVEKKTGETEKKFSEVEKKTEEVKRRSLKDRIELGGEARFRITSETAHTESGFYGNGLTGETSEEKPAEGFKIHDETAFPTRIRLNAHVEVAPEIVDFYARMTVNKRWGTLDEFSLTDPFGRPNSFVSSIGRDVTPRFEQAYMTLKLPYDITWYVGRLPGMDGPPSRQARSLFPRLFIDSEIDGTLVKWDAPETFLDDIELPWAGKVWEKPKDQSNNKPVERKFATLEGYEKKVKERSGIILGYLKYDERKISLPDDADVFLGQAELRIGKDTAIILNGLYMDDWHMPRTSFGTKDRLTVYRVTGITKPTDTREDIVVPDLITPYHLIGGYADTQLFGLQIYCAYYWSHFNIPEHTVHWYQNGTTLDIIDRPPVTFEDKDFPGHIWYAGFNTGDLIGQNFQFCLEYAKGSDAWINPFNYRGFRRKGTVLQPANNYFYNPAGVDNVTVGFYPFNAGVWDIYFDYFFRPNVRFRLGMMDFIYTKHDHDNIQNVSVLGSSAFQNYWWPYFEVNLSF